MSMGAWTHSNFRGELQKYVNRNQRAWMTLKGHYGVTHSISKYMGFQSLPRKFE